MHLKLLFPFTRLACPSPFATKVHYPGWEAKWDEWVPRERLRWGNERLAAALEGIAPRKGDSVEMWCQGLHVPGAWLEAVVHKAEKDRLYLGEVCYIVYSGRQMVGVIDGGRTILRVFLSVVVAFRTFAVNLCR